MKKLLINEIPIPKGATHPKPPSEILPYHEFTMGIIAPKGQGKTTLIINLINFYKKYFNHIVIISPTAKNDPKWDWLLSQEILVENRELKEILKNLKNSKKNEIVEERPKQLTDADLLANAKQIVEEKAFSPQIPEECLITDYDQTTLIDLIEEQQSIIELLKLHGYTKHKAHRVLLVCDDMVGSELFSSHHRNPFKMMNANHRHLSLSILMITQAYKEIPKTVRTQFSCLILLKIFSEKEKEVIMEEYPMDMYKDKWQQVYEHCTNEPYTFLYFNSQKPIGQRVMKCFDQYISID